ncbi:MAG TPA: HD domain-containing phosphohydrolase [Candidatus Dormibacteraeota bacterium]|nr:HD domain-containing phosphohydrolase [Candidatus Dormibacteraeota bacterium]
MNVRRQSTPEWRSRPFLSFGLRAFVFVTPVAAGLWVVAELASVWSRPAQIAELVAWWALITLAGLGTLFLVERATRQLLPLAALLRLSLLFPDHAPDRFAVARRAARPKQVLRQLEALGEDGTSVEVQAAQKVLELSVALSVHDRATRGHSERVQVLTDMISRELHLPEPDRARLRWAALLHDIGKLKVPSRILNKPAKPDAREWTILRRHPAEGARIAAPVLPWLGVWGEAVAQHHEWYDGTGYPVGLRGSEIAKAARVVAVADVFEVITAPRPYRRPVSIAQAREELVRASGTQLDPKVIRAFLNVSVGELWPVVGLGAILCQVPLVSQAFGIFSRALPGRGGSTAAAGAAGAILVAGISHPAEVRTLPRAPASVSQPTHSTPPNESSQPAQVPNLPVQAPAAALPGQSAQADASETASGPTVDVPTPTVPSPPLPTPFTVPVPTPSPLQLPAPVPQLLSQIRSLLQRLGL